jgi:SAM-dependent methyltransferase
MVTQPSPEVLKLLEQGVIVAPETGEPFQETPEGWAWPQDGRPLRWSPHGGAVLMREAAVDAATNEMLRPGSKRATGGRTSRSGLSKLLHDRVVDVWFPNPKGMAAQERVLRETESPWVSVGGGPRSVAPGVLNLNIDPTENVHLVASAYALPFADASVGGAFFYSTLEHLRRAEAALTETLRALRPGSLVLAFTPFLLGFHGYPSHYRNYTLRGHEALFEDQGFELVDSDWLLGPGRVLQDYLHFLVNELPLLPPGKLRKALNFGLRTSARLLRPIGRRLERSPNSDRLASLTYVLARKPRRQR